MRNVKLLLAYDGTAYAGWQVQPGRATVQGTLETAIEKVTGQPARVLGSGRTDAGVHALGQVAAFRTPTRLPTDVLRRALNAELPRDIAILEVSEVPDGFHAIRDVVRKRYCYVIHDGPVREVFWRPYCWRFVHGRLDTQAMHHAAQPLVGTHDFRSFQASGAEPEHSVRTVFELRVRRGGAGQGGPRLVAATAHPKLRTAAPPPAHAERDQDDWIAVEAEADGFLYTMVRVIVGTLVEVGRGARPENWPAEVLRAGRRAAAGPTAPPQGLFLVHVEYRP